MPGTDRHLSFMSGICVTLSGVREASLRIFCFKRGVLEFGTSTETLPSQTLFAFSCEGLM